MKKSFLYSIIFLCASILFSCKKDASDPAPSNPGATTESGTLKVEFEHVVDGTDMEFNTAYTSQNNETFKITTLKYYVSNIVLTGIDNTTHSIPESYFLIDASSSAASLISIPNIPVGQYKNISFLLGVDSTRNVDGKQEGALDKANGMFWSWKTGYIFTKYEGAFSNATVTDSTFMYHLGGYKKADNSLRTVSIPFTASVLTVNKTGIPQVHLEVDVYQLIKNFSTTISFMGASAPFADNAASMFTFEHIHN